MAAQFFADEKVAAVIERSRDGDNGVGSGGTSYDDRFTSIPGGAVAGFEIKLFFAVDFPAPKRL